MASDYTRTVTSLDTKSVLKHLDVELTERCNNDCVHCYIRKDTGSRIQDAGCGDDGIGSCEMTAAEVEGVLEEAQGLGCLTVRFTGGEPLLREDFEEIYIAARELGLRVIISTNATLITQELANVFARVPPLEDLDITLYGAGRETYEAVSRSPGSFNEACRGLALLSGKTIPFSIRSIVLPQNSCDAQSLATWRKIQPTMPDPLPPTIYLDLRARRDSSTKNDAIRKLRMPPSDIVAWLSQDRAKYAAEHRGFCRKFAGPPGGLLFRCGAGTNSTCVDAYGNVQMCLLLRHPETVLPKKQRIKGKGSRGRLEYALEEFFPEVRKKQATNSDYLARCAKCFLNGLCEQCPAKSWMEHGTLDTPVEYYCEITHLQALDLGLLKPGEKAWQVPDWQQRLQAFCA